MINSRNPVFGYITNQKRVYLKLTIEIETQLNNIHVKCNFFFGLSFVICYTFRVWTCTCIAIDRKFITS